MRRVRWRACLRKGPRYSFTGFIFTTTTSSSATCRGQARSQPGDPGEPRGTASRRAGVRSELVDMQAQRKRARPDSVAGPDCTRPGGLGQLHSPNPPSAAAGRHSAGKAQRSSPSPPPCHPTASSHEVPPPHPPACAGCPAPPPAAGCPRPAPAPRRRRRPRPLSLLCTARPAGGVVGGGWQQPWAGRHLLTAGHRSGIGPWRRRADYASTQPLLTLTTVGMCCPLRAPRAPHARCPAHLQPPIKHSSATSANRPTARRPPPGWHPCRAPATAPP